MTIAAPRINTVSTTLITGDELLELGDIGPCELIDGRIVPMPPAGDEHGTIEFSLGGELRNFVRHHKLGRITGGETGIYIRRKPDRIRAADIVFLSTSRAGDRPGKGFLEVAPDLIVEIMSPTDRWQDVRQKLADYFSIGVQWVWVVEPDNRAVLVYRSLADVTVLGEADVLRGEGVLEGFEMAVRDVFEG